MSIQITALYASLLAIMYVVLSLRVARRRQKFQVGLGAGESKELERAIRIHGNFAEYVPLALILMGCFEIGGGPSWAVHTAGLVLLVARVLHAIGLTQSGGTSPGRFAGASATFLLLLALAAGNLLLIIR